MGSLKEKFEAFLKKYKLYLRNAGIKLEPGVWFALSLAVGIILAAIGFFFLTIINASAFFVESGIEISPLFSFILFIVGLDLGLGYPYLKNMQRIDSIEENLADVLKQIADTLKAGATYEYAFREVASSNYGALSKEIETVLRKLEEGENLENALRTLPENVDSKFVRRIVTIIIDSIKAGAGLAEVLEDIADDVRELRRLYRERKTKTLLQTMFLFAAGGLIAPLILGFVSSLINFLVQVAAFGLNIGKAATEEAIKTKNSMVFLMQVYLMIELIASSATISLMRDGKITKTIIYAPALLLIGFILYYVGVIFATLAIGKSV